MSIQNLLFYLIGGIAIFLFGIKYMSEGLHKVSGDRIRHLLAVYTANPLLGVLVGMLVTVVFQSVTGAVILIIGLINAGILSLKQAVHVLIGANMGTIITVFVVGIHIESYALPIIAVGVFFLLFVKYKRMQYIGQIIMGFGTLFLGLAFIRDGLRLEESSEQINQFILGLSDIPMLGLVSGLVLSVVLTSSSAAIGVLQTFGHEGLLELKSAVPIMLGSNIGSAIIAGIAVFGASLKAKRVVLINFIYYILGSILFVILQPWLLKLIDYSSQLISMKLQIAISHSVFQLITGLVCLLLASLMIKLSQVLIQPHHSTSEITFGAQYLDKRFLATPSVAIGQAKLEILRMGSLARETLAHAERYFFEHDSREMNLALKKEALVNELNHLITDYMVSIHQHDLTAGDSERLMGLMHIVNDLERIGDHAENIVELAEYQVINRLQFSDAAIAELKQMMDVADWTIGRVLYALEHRDRGAAADVLAHEAELDRMDYEFRLHHFNRLNDNICRGNSGAIFLDVLSNLERVGDHSKNIAEIILK